MMRISLISWVFCVLLFACDNAQSNRQNPAPKGYQKLINEGKSFEILIPDGWKKYEKLKWDKFEITGPQSQMSKVVDPKVSVIVQRGDAHFAENSDVGSRKKINTDQYINNYLKQLKKLDGFSELKNQHAKEKTNGDPYKYAYTYIHPKTAQIILEKLTFYPSDYRLYVVKCTSLKEEFFRIDEICLDISENFQILDKKNPLL